jgi:hypothetical protein
MLTMLGGVKFWWSDSSTKVQDQSSCELFIKNQQSYKMKKK